MKVKIGDTVRLKSGCPLMTVDGEVEDKLRCVWFDEKHIRYQHIFDPLTLQADDGIPHIG